MAVNSLYCADVPLSNYSLTTTTRDDGKKGEEGDKTVDFDADDGIAN